VAVHLSLLWLPGINLEWVFADGASYFASHDPGLLKYYFSLEANTLGVPFVGFLLRHVLPFLDYNAVLRVLAASSFPLIGYSLIKLHTLLEQDYNPAVLLGVVFLNPLVWTFGGRGTADLFPAALTLFAIALLWQPDASLMQLALALAAYGIAIMLKYHAALLLPMVGLELLTRPGAGVRKALTRYCLIVAGILTLPALYLLLIKHSYGFWFAPPKFQSIHAAHLGVAAVVMTVIGYAAYLALLLLPYSLSVVWEQVRTVRRAGVTLLAAVGAFIVGAYALRVGTEMRFGPLDAYISPRIYSGSFLVFAVFCLLASRNMLSRAASSPGHRYIVCILLGIAIYIALLSFTRPAQRYLLFVLPLSYLLLLDRVKCGKYWTTATALIYVALIIFITLNQIATGSVAHKMVEQLDAHGWIANTEPGALTGTMGNLFPDQGTDANHRPYIVVAGASPDAIVTVESHPAPFVHKVLSLVRYEEAPPTADPLQ
jgi:hypothetical protein